MRKDVSTTSGGVKITSVTEWKYCEPCGFCHDKDFPRCLKPHSTPRPLPDGKSG